MLAVAFALAFARALVMSWALFHETDLANVLLPMLLFDLGVLCVFYAAVLR